MPHFNLVKAILIKELEIAVTNAPINEAAGNAAQARLERETADELRKALAVLNQDAAMDIILNSIGH